MFTTRTHRTIGALTLTMAAAFLVTVFAPRVRAQQPSSEEQLNTLMEHRQEMSKRSIEETQKRRFEEGKSDTTFPSDRAILRRGVLHVLTPEQQKALDSNERGLQLFTKGKFDAAMKEYQQAIQFDPELAAAHNNLGTAYFALGRLEDASAAFHHACELDDDYGQAFFNLALVQIKLGQQKEANATLDLALRAYNSAGAAHLKARRLKEAEEAFRGMLQIDPEYSVALIGLGLVSNAARRYEEAAGYGRRVAEREPANVAAHEILAEAFYGGQKYEEAAASADRAIKLSPDSADAHYLAGLSRASLGQRDSALAHVARLQQLKSPDLAQQLSDFINKKTPPPSQ